VAGLEEIAARARASGARARILDGQEARSIAPCIAGDVLGALDIPDEGVINSIRLTRAVPNWAPATASASTSARP
jgi:L-2-hydroxyglutarate oxidase LhgO